MSVGPSPDISGNITVGPGDPMMYVSYGGPYHTIGMPPSVCQGSGGFTRAECVHACAINGFPPILCRNFCAKVVNMGCDRLFSYCGGIPGNNMKNMCMAIYLTLCFGE